LTRELDAQRRDFQTTVKALEDSERTVAEYQQKEVDWIRRGNQHQQVVRSDGD